MGCFNASCGISHISIGGGVKAGLILLLPNEFNLTRDLEKTKGCLSQHPTHLMCTNEGAFGLYCAISLPIWGEYNDYGTLENIEKNDGTIALEKYFKLSIETILEYVSTYRCKDEVDVEGAENLNILEYCSAMFVRRDVYDRLRKKDFESGNNMFEKGDLTSKMLESLGFTLKKTLSKEEEERYNKIYMHKSSAAYAMASDGRWSHIVTDTGEKVKSWTYHPKDLQKEWEKYTRYTIDMEFLKGQSQYINAAAPILERKARTKQLDEAFVKAIEHKELFKDLKELMELDCDMRAGLFRGPFVKIYEDCPPQWLTRHMANFSHIYWVMYCCNRLFMPTFSGPQCGEYAVEQMMNEVVQSVLKKERR